MPNHITISELVSYSRKRDRAKVEFPSFSDADCFRLRAAAFSEFGAAKLLEAGVNEKDARLAVAVLSIGETVNFTEDPAWDAARLRPITKQYGLSLGDRV